MLIIYYVMNMELIYNLKFISLSWQILLPIIFMMIDVITGYLQSIINKNTDSFVMRKGILHKCLLIIIILISYLLHFSFNISYISNFVSIYIIIMELTSIFENIKKGGIDFNIIDFLNNGGDKIEKK